MHDSAHRPRFFSFFRRFEITVLHSHHRQNRGLTQNENRCACIGFFVNPFSTREQKQPLHKNAKTRVPSAQQTAHSKIFQTENVVHRHAEALGYGNEKFHRGNAFARFPKGYRVLRYGKQGPELFLRQMIVRSDFFQSRSYFGCIRHIYSLRKKFVKYLTYEKFSYKVKSRRIHTYE